MPSIVYGEKLDQVFQVSDLSNQDKKRDLTYSPSTESNMSFLST